MFKEKYFPLKIRLENNDEIKILTYAEYLESKYSFIVLECNAKEVNNA